VLFYGTALSGPECAKRKAAAFAKSPDFAQTLGEIKIEPRDAGGGWVVRFTKTTTEKGKSHDYPAVLVLDARLAISQESDKVTEANLASMARPSERWCLDGDGSPNTRVIPPFTVSMAAALSAVWSSKHMKELQASYDGASLGVDIPFSCPTSCVVAEQQCGYHFRVVNLSNLGVTTSIMVEWVYVDAVKKVLMPQKYEGFAWGDWTPEPIQ
jgi:hypothetical protein